MCAPVFWCGLAIALSPIGGWIESTEVVLPTTINIFIWTVFFILLSSILLKTSHFWSFPGCPVPYPKSCIRIPVGVVYGNDTQKVKSALLAVTEASEQVCRYPEARVRFRQFGVSRLTLNCSAGLNNRRNAAW